MIVIACLVIIRLYKISAILEKGKGKCRKWLTIFLGRIYSNQNLKIPNVPASFLAFLLLSLITS